MAYKIIQTAHAAQDLDSILSYISENLDNKPAAAAFLDEVEACYTSLEKMPFMYEQCRDPRLHSFGYRKSVIKNYIMVYSVDEQKQAVYVQRFFHGSQNYAELL